MICFGSKLKKINIEWLEDWINSYMADSRSLYLLELFPGSQWHNQLHNIDQIKDPKLIKLINPDDNAIMDEYSQFHSMLMDA